MQIDRLSHESITSMFRAFDHTAHDEIETMYTGEALNRGSMQRLLEYLRSTTARRLQGGDVDITTTLDISVDITSRTGSVRVTLAGEDTVKAALLGLQQGFSQAQIMHKRRMKPSVEVREHRLRVNMKREESITDLREVREAIDHASSGNRKVYRLKKRFSFPATDPGFRYDITAVRQTTQATTPTWTDLSEIPEKYEVECEYIGTGRSASGSTKNEAASLATTLLKCFGTLLKVLDDTDRLMTTTQRTHVLTEFLSLMYPSEVNTWTSQVAAGQVQHRFIPGPKPVTLEYHHLLGSGSVVSKDKGKTKQPSCEDEIAEQSDSISVVGGVAYTVTEKADGVHRVLFVSRSGMAYTLAVEGHVIVRDTGLSCRSGGRGTSSVIDGEFMRETVTTGPIFAAYDAFVFEGSDVRSLQLMREGEGGSTSSRVEKKKDGETQRSPALSRLSACHVVASSLAASTDVTTSRVMVKTFMWYHGDMDGMTASVRKIMARRDAGNFPYSIDGLILTPAAWPMGASAAGAAVKSSGAWSATLKWKPPDQNSIDFLVRLVPNEIVRRNNESYRVAHLHVGYDPNKWDPVTTHDVLTEATRNPMRRNYVEHPFGLPGASRAAGGDLHVCHLRVSDQDDRIICSNGEDVITGTIVEFTFDMQAMQDVPTSFRWVALRPRPDKTLLYVSSGGEIGRAANDIVSAMSVWSSIQRPVTEDVMCGRAKITRVEERDTGPAAYYLNKVRPGEGGMAAMRDFHNWVKSRDLMLRLKGDSTRSLFDIGVGRAGDLHTWLKLGLTRVMGVDLYRDGIVNPENGANVRILEMRKKNKGRPFPRIVLLPMDASRDIDAEQIEGMQDEMGDKYVARVVWSLVDAASVKDSRLRRYHGFATGGFDVVSCQFAIHYFFNTRVTLAAFASNVAKHIRPGGYFVGTCMDAKRVDDAFGDTRCIQGVAGGKVIWRIQRLYDTLDMSGDFRANTGLRIKVYVQTIGQVVEEFLVDYRLLRSALAEVGLVPPSDQQLSALGLQGVEGGTCLFEACYRRMAKDQDSDKHVTSALTMSDDEKAFSFLNRWFIFVKTLK